MDELQLPPLQTPTTASCLPERKKGTTSLTMPPSTEENLESIILDSLCQVSPIIWKKMQTISPLLQTVCDFQFALATLTIIATERHIPIFYKLECMSQFL